MQKYLLLILLTGSIQRAFAQDTAYYDKTGNLVTASALYDHRSITTRDPADSNVAMVRMTYRSGQVRCEYRLSNYEKHIMGGSYKDYFENGHTRTTATYIDDKLDGELKTYFENGQLRRDDLFSGGKLLHGKCFDSLGKPVPHTDWEVPPEYPGGIPALIGYLSREVKYPKEARKKNIQGEVDVQFRVDKEGKVGYVQVVKHVAPELDQEAVRVVSQMHRWKPGTQEGEAVAVDYTLPIRFVLTDTKGK